MNVIKSLNPATGQIEREFRALTPDEIDNHLERAATVFSRYRETSFSDRSRWLLEVSKNLESKSNALARLITSEMGKPLQSAIQEVKKCAWNCRYFAESGSKFLQEEEVATPPARGIIRYDPLGPILAIMPWNFPFWQVFRFAAPTLMAGNVILLKHASNVPQCALKIESIFKESGFPRDVFQTLLIGSEQVSSVIEDDRVAAVTLTGSVEAGRAVAKTCGASIKKIVLELGGSDPFIVMPTADLDQAIQTAVEAKILNSGQSCVAPKRFVVAESIAGEFERQIIQRMRELRVGDPMDPKTHVGPLATESILLRIEQQVDNSIRMGAELLLGGRRLDHPGYYYPPTVLGRIPRNSPAYREELFGPVIALFRVEDVQEAIAIANDTRFGLGASVWTQDKREQLLFIRDLQVGSVSINQRVASDPRLPFGGIKHSGYGRELGVWGIREFVNIKAISILQKVGRQ